MDPNIAQGALIGGGLICGASLTVVGLAGTWQVDCAALTAMGLGFYMLHASIQVYVTEFAPAARSSAVAFHTFSFFVGGGISPVLYGGGLDRLGPGMTLSIAAVAMVLIGIVSAQLLVKPRPT